MNDYYELLMSYALNDKNYKGWRKEHTKIFGDIFALAFTENTEAQIHLTAALINISQRNFVGAIPKLDILKTLYINEYDCAVVDYFTGLNCEMLGNEADMDEHYGKVRTSNVSFIFPLPFHPYYRTAKFAQRDSECSKAVFYYQKALEFYDGTVPDTKTKSTVSQIIYDIATICLYMHRYDECERFLELSKKYDTSDNQHRTYVTSILRAAQGKEDESRKLLDKLNRFFRENCEPMVDAILTQKDPHYCVVPQYRSQYSDFWNYIVLHKSDLEELISKQKKDESQKNISDNLSATMAFMKRQLDCRVESANGKITVFCKNYCVKTLACEYDTLFEDKPSELENWDFISVKWFENY